MIDIHAELETVFRNVFGDDGLRLEDHMTAAAIDGWDSIATINLVIAIEMQFGIKLSAAEISGIKAEGQNVGSLVALISKKLNV